eukprot:TRINITY_DN9012_c0_g1_i1.p1 TRINITY_DN9012_c0_g1~~TRINITY_DN9012_c0_g1_i1.p1  ORF type:complete len:237 (-),score=39.51 TRINITY_DN9012_c0_g1_i1:176-886(-)
MALKLPFVLGSIVLGSTSAVSTLTEQEQNDCATIQADAECIEDDTGSCGLALRQLRAVKGAALSTAGYDCRHCLPDQCVQVGHPECLSENGASLVTAGYDCRHCLPDQCVQVGHPECLSENGASLVTAGYDCRHCLPDQCVQVGHPECLSGAGSYFPPYDTPSGSKYPPYYTPSSVGYSPPTTPGSSSSIKGNCLTGPDCSALDSTIAPVVCGSTTCCCTGSIAPQLNGNMCTCLR